MSFDVVTFGEAMVRLTPPLFQRIEQASELWMHVGGGEFNVAIGASRLGLTSAWVSALPVNPLGRLVRNKAREHGVNTDYVAWHEKERCGLYFLEMGTAPRPNAVLYDRANAAVSNLQPGELDWDGVFAGAKAFHVSGITPALSASCCEVTMEALQKAKQHGLFVSYDLNYRKNLWSTAEAAAAQEPMMDYVDLLITTEDDANEVFGHQGAPASVCRELKERFGFTAAAMTLRRIDTVLRHGWTSIIYADKLYEDVTYELENVDRVGGGDSFSAGCLYGWLTTQDWQQAVAWGDAFSALKHTNLGDVNFATREETERLMKSYGDKLRFKIQR
ncbi:MAG TPA: sugar kinase [Armatimonadota bacterium]|jgi:2-dehydro-3-deoxygluconokinase